VRVEHVVVQLEGVGVVIGVLVVALVLEASRAVLADGLNHDVVAFARQDRFVGTSRPSTSGSGLSSSATKRPSGAASTGTTAGAGRLMASGAACSGATAADVAR